MISFIVCLLLLITGYLTYGKIVIGMIPEGHPVVFISYSWDSPEHKVWVSVKVLATL